VNANGRVKLARFKAPCCLVARTYYYMHVHNETSNAGSLNI